MNNKKLPTVSILIVNYNGRAFIGNCLSSLRKVNYPKKKIEIILVDNNSSDDSVAYINKNFPEIHLIESSENLGFTGGNNKALEHATGEYIVLLNSDTTVDKGWLTHLVHTAEANEQTGIVASKLRFAIPFLEMTIDSKVITRADMDQETDFSPLGVLVEEVICVNKELNSLIWYKDGFYQKTKDELTLRWTNGNGKINIPFASDDVEEFLITIHGYPSQESFSTPVSIKIGKKEYISDKINSNEVKQYKIKILKKDHTDEFQYLIQNAGTILLYDGHAKDRGSILRDTEKERLEFYDQDSKFYDQPKQLLSMCGAGCLIKREVINKIQFLDGYYFMYYEDVDFSIRAWKMGWDIVYEPKATVYHMHRASTGKGESTFFLHMVERNHLSLVITHFPIVTIIRQLVFFTIWFFITLLLLNKYRFSGNIGKFRLWKIRTNARLQTIEYICRQTPRLLKNRWYWKRNEIRHYQDMIPFMY